MTRIHTAPVWNEIGAVTCLCTKLWLSCVEMTGQQPEALFAKAEQLFVSVELQLLGPSPEAVTS